MSGKIEFQTGHVGLNVRDADISSRFYQSIFGFQEIGRSVNGEQRYIFLGANGRVALTLWQQSQLPFQKDHAGLHHLSFQVESMNEIQQIQARLREHNVRLFYDGVVPHQEGSHSGGLYFEDPDGIRLEIYTAEGAQRYHAPHSDAPSCGFF